MIRQAAVDEQTVNTYLISMYTDGIAGCIVVLSILSSSLMNNYLPTAHGLSSICLQRKLESLLEQRDTSTEGWMVLVYYTIMYVVLV